jgi:RND superfamily putative drug exporter
LKYSRDRKVAMSKVSRFELRSRQLETRVSGGGSATGALSTLTRFVLNHKGVVGLAWIVLACVGFAILPSATKGFSKGFTAPGREAYVVNQTMLKRYGAVGDVSPIVAVVHLPDGVKATSPGVRMRLARVFAAL